MENDYTDGPIERGVFDRDQLIESIVVRLGAFAVTANKDSRTNDTSYRMAAWVETPDETKGYALVLDKPHLNINGDLNVDGRYMIVNRDNRSIINRTPLSLTYSQSEGRTEVNEEALEPIDNDDLENILALLIKSAARYDQTPDNTTPNNGLVLATIAGDDEMLDELAEQEKRAPKVDEEIEPTVPVNLIEEFDSLLRARSDYEPDASYYIRHMSKEYSCAVEIIQNSNDLFFISAGAVHGRHHSYTGFIRDEKDTSKFVPMRSDMDKSDLMMEMIRATIRNGKRCNEASAQNVIVQCMEHTDDDFYEKRDTLWRGVDRRAGRNRSAGL